MLLAWLVTAVVWALGIHPTYSGLQEAAESDENYLELEPGEKKIANSLIVLCSVFWPVCALYELAVDVLGPKEGEENDDR